MAIWVCSSVACALFMFLKCLILNFPFTSFIVLVFLLTCIFFFLQSMPPMMVWAKENLSMKLSSNATRKDHFPRLKV